MKRIGPSSLVRAGPWAGALVRGVTLNTKTDSLNGTIFENLQMVFAGDFCQLKPPQIGSYPLYVYKDCALWYHRVNTYFFRAPYKS